MIGLPGTWLSSLIAKFRKLPLLSFLLWTRKAKRTRENSSKNQECKQSRNKVQADEKLTICKTRRKRNPSDLSHRGFSLDPTEIGTC